MKRKLFGKNPFVLALICAMFASSTEMHARGRATVAAANQSHVGSRTNRHPNGRLIVQRVPNFGSDLFIRLSIDGKGDADIRRNQHYGGLLKAGPNVLTLT